MTQNEFADMVNQGGDFMFDCAGKHYALCYWSDSPIIIAEQNTEANKQEFETVDELMTQYNVNGIPLGEQISKIVVAYQS